MNLGKVPCLSNILFNTKVALTKQLGIQCEHPVKMFENEKNINLSRWELQPVTVVILAEKSTYRTSTVVWRKV